MDKNKLSLTDQEAGYLILLVEDDNKKLSSDKRYPGYGTLHSLLRKLQQIGNEIADRQEQSRDRD